MSKQLNSAGSELNLMVFCNQGAVSGRRLVRAANCPDQVAADNALLSVMT